MSTQSHVDEFERIARNYTRRMKNDARRRYAVAYATALIATDLLVDDVQAPSCDYLSACQQQGVQAMLDDVAKRVLAK